MNVSGRTAGQIDELAVKLARATLTSRNEMRKANSRSLRVLARGNRMLAGVARWIASVRAFFLGYHVQILDSIAPTAKIAKSGIE